MAQAKRNVQKHKKISLKSRKSRKSSGDFLKTYESIYEEGPKVKYKNPDAWIRAPVKE